MRPHAYTQTHVRAYTHMVSASRKLPSQKESSMPPTNLSSCLMNYTKQKSKSERLDAALLSWSLVDDSIHVGSSTTEFCLESPRWIKTHDGFLKAIVIQVQKQLRVDLNPPKNYSGRFLSRQVGFIFILFQYQNKSDRIILPGTFRELDEVCSEVPEDSRVLRVRRKFETMQ